MTARGVHRLRPTVDPAFQGESVAAVKLAFHRHLRWIARPLPDDDWGVDMHAETVEGSRATGRLIGVQIKAGPSYFAETVADGWVFRDDSHLEYWTSYSLPVIVVLYDPTTTTCYWQAVRPSTVTSTGKGWKMTIPRSQVVDADAEAALRELAGSGDPYMNRLALLRADLDLINAAAEDRRILVEVEESVNKLSGRGYVRITVEGTDGTQLVRALDFYAAGWSYEELLPSLFPWADLSLERETYEEHDRAVWDLETGAWDSEEGRYILHSIDFDDWAAGISSGLRPYSDDGEVALWRLEARLGPVGSGFLALDSFLAAGTVARTT